MNDNSCFKCSERFVGCHSTCEKYKSWKKEQYARNSIIFNERNKEHRTRDFKIKQVLKTTRKPRNEN